MTAPIRALPLPDTLRYALATPAGRYVPALPGGARARRGDVLAVRRARAGQSAGGAAAAATCTAATGADREPPAIDALRAATSGRVEIAPGALLLHADGRDEPAPPLTAPDFLERIREAGIVGMGGAGYPAHLKLRAAIERGVHTVIANAVECEPGVNADRTLLERHADDVRRGLEALSAQLGGARAILAVGAPLQFDAGVETHVASGPYPAGWERALTQRLLGLETPANGYPSSVGAVVFNVATVFAMARAWHCGEPLTRRVVTIGAEPCWTRIGHPVAELPLAPGAKRIGGSITGWPAPPEAAVSRTTRAVALRAPAPSTPCIRCGWCASACPVGLLPQELLRAATAQRWQALQRLRLDACIECGACDLACPSRLPLLDRFRVAKSERAAAARRQRQAALAKQHVEQRRERLARAASEAARRRAERLRNQHRWQTDAGVAEPAERPDAAADERP